MLAIGSCAGRDSDPKSNGVGGVGCDGSDSSKHQRREGDETSSASDGVKRAAESPGEKEKDGGVEVQVIDVSRKARAANCCIGRGGCV